MTTYHLPPCPTPACPIQNEVEKVKKISKDFAQAIRQLRQDLTKCNQCTLTLRAHTPSGSPQGDQCELHNYFRNTIQAAIEQVNEEWNLADVIEYI